MGPRLGMAISASACELRRHTEAHARLGIAALVVGWILVVFLVAQLVAVVIPSNRSLWFERIDGGITLRWKDRGIALPEDERESEQPASSSA